MYIQNHVDNSDFLIVHIFFKDVPGGFPKSDLLGVTVALMHVAV